MSKKQRSPYPLCGRMAGTATGWDQSDTFAMTLYGFEPGQGCTLPAGDIYVNFETGAVELYDRKGEVVAKTDLFDSLKDAPRYQPLAE